MVKKPKRLLSRRHRQSVERPTEDIDDHDHPRSHEIDDEAKKMISDVKERVVHAAVLNGGFDKLYMKIESIEAGQQQIVERVDSIHDAIFNPDEGIFSRLAQTKIEQIEIVADVDKQLASIITWKDQQDKLAEKDANADTKMSETIQSHQKTIDDLMKWKTTISAIGKWFAAALIGATISLMFKLLYDAIILHWK